MFLLGIYFAFMNNGKNFCCYYSFYVLPNSKWCGSFHVVTDLELVLMWGAFFLGPMCIISFFSSLVLYVFGNISKGTPFFPYSCNSLSVFLSIHRNVSQGSHFHIAFYKNLGSHHRFDCCFVYCLIYLLFLRNAWSC